MVRYAGMSGMDSYNRMGSGDEFPIAAAGYPALESVSTGPDFPQEFHPLELLSVAILGLLAYLLGSIPPAYWLTRAVKGVDLREVGSRNVGTLNTYHQVGPWGAALVLLVDGGKGAVAVLLPGWVNALGWAVAPPWAVYVTALLVVAGHNWTFLLGFRGGKGAASIIGICLAFVPIPALLAIVPGLLAVILSRNAIVGLTVGYILLNLLVIAAALFNLDWLVAEPGLYQVGLCLLLTAVVFVSYVISIRVQLLNALRHRSLREVFYGGNPAENSRD